MLTRVIIKHSSKDRTPIFILNTGLSIGMSPENMPGNIIGDDYDGKDLLEFISLVISSTNQKDEYWTNGYTAKVVEKDGKNMIKIYFRLTDDYEPYYIAPEEFKEILEIYIREKKKFDEEPELYKINLVKHGANVINFEEHKSDSEAYERAISESENGVVIVKNAQEKAELEAMR